MTDSVDAGDGGVVLGGGVEVGDGPAARAKWIHAPSEALRSWQTVAPPESSAPSVSKEATVPGARITTTRAPRTSVSQIDTPRMIPLFLAFATKRPSIFASSSSSSSLIVNVISGRVYDLRPGARGGLPRAHLGSGNRRLGGIVQRRNRDSLHREWPRHPNLVPIYLRLIIALLLIGALPEDSLDLPAAFASQLVRIQVPILRNRSQGQVWNGLIDE